MFVELPKIVLGLVSFNRRSDTHYGKQETINALIRIGHEWAQSDATPIGVGHISRRDGSRFPPHKSHRKGVDVDIRPMRKDGKNLPVTIQSKMYDAEATRMVVNVIRAQSKVKLILFNDPKLVKAGLTQMYPNHSNHLHVRLDY